jgi:hypothetical protein
MLARLVWWIAWCLSDDGWLKRRRGKQRKDEK